MSRSYDENYIDRLFRDADLGMRLSHKEELRRRLFKDMNSEDELSEDELLAAAGGNRKPDDPLDKLN